jgi:SpoVK/Ycf46/Vps4 family AAA+-type ATPase
VIIDEVETVAGSRERSAANGEVGDALRATNQLLTALDKLRCFTNVLVFCTSNLIQTVDGAFLSRVDTAKYIGNPISAATYEILRSCLEDLIRSGLIAISEREEKKETNGERDITMQACDDAYGSVEEDSQTQSVDCFPQYRTAAMKECIEPDSLGTQLLAISKRCVGFSGRLLRRLPLLALATYTFYEPTPLRDAMEALSRAIDDEKQEDGASVIGHEPLDEGV